MEIDEETAFKEIQNIRYPQRNKTHEKPQQSTEERAIITNLHKIEALNKQARILQDKIHENPLDFMSAVVWEVQLEKLAFVEKKLLKRNEKLWKGIGKQPPEQQQQYPKINIANTPKINPNIGYKPINLTTLVHQNQTLELQKTEEQLETVYDQKNLLFQQIQNSPTGIANLELSHELDTVIQLEAKLISKIEELRFDIEAKSLSSNSKVESVEVDSNVEKSNENMEQIKENELDNMGVEEVEDFYSLDTEETQAYDEIQSVRDSEDEDRDEIHFEDVNDDYDVDFS